MEPTHFLFASKLSHPIHFDTPPSLRAVFRAQAQLSCLPLKCRKPRRTFKHRCYWSPEQLSAGALSGGPRFQGVRIRRSPPPSVVPSPDDKTKMCPGLFCLSGISLNHTV